MLKFMVILWYSLPTHKEVHTEMLMPFLQSAGAAVPSYDSNAYAPVPSPKRPMS